MAPPNILFIAVDDLFDFTAFRDSFGVSIQTPNMDALLEKSAHFTAGFSTVPGCNPSRTATMTGYTNFETDIHDNATQWYERVDPEDSFPAILKDNGYHNATAGKIFHNYVPQPEFVNDVLYSEPTPRIFDTFDRSLANPNGGYWNAQGYEGMDDAFYDYGVSEYGRNFIETYEGDDPFMLLLGFKHPHNTYETPQEFYDLYDKSAIKVPDSWIEGDLADAPAFAEQFMVNGHFQPEEDFEKWQATVEGYLASVSHVDAMIGRVLNQLEASPYADDTAIVLYSDHGYQLGEKEHFSKFTLWEESARAPLAVKMPGQEVGLSIDTPVTFMDIMPTILDLADVDPVDRSVGQSLLPLIDENYGTYDAKPVFTHIYGSMSIRDGDYRYIRYADGTEEMYDVKNDPSQNVNLANDPGQALKLAEMRDDLAITAGEHGATVDYLSETILGTEGNDIVVVQPGNEEVALGEGDDNYFTYGGDVPVVELPDEGNDTVYFSGIDTFDLPDNVENGVHGTSSTRDPVTLEATWVEINGNELDNEIRIQAAHGRVTGGDGDDEIRAAPWSVNEFDGGEGNDSMTGGNWADRFTGGAGNDRLDGSNGNDYLNGGEGADDIIGSGGWDSAIYHDATSGVAASLLTNTGTGGEAAGDRFFWVEALEGSQHGDTLEGSNEGNVLRGYGGHDVLIGHGGGDILNGGTGVDTASYAGSAAGVTVSLTTNSGQGGDAEGDVLGAIENLVGSSSADWLEGDGGDNALTGGIGNDTLVGRDGADTIYGNGGSDTVDYSASSGQVHVSLLTGNGYGGDAWGDRILTVENLIGSDHDDVFMGDMADNLLMGGAGNDSLFGRPGDDTLVGGAGADVLAAGAGIDMVSYADSDAGVHVSLYSGRGYGGHAQGDTLANVEALEGSAHGDVFMGTERSDWFFGGEGNDSIFAREGDDYIHGGKGADLMSAGTGNDTISYEGSEAGVHVSLLSGRGYGGDAAGDTMATAEALVGSDHGDVLMGDQLDNMFAGGDGNDSLFGRDGDDVFRGGAGADLMTGGSGSDWASYRDAEGDVQVDLSTGQGSGDIAEGDLLSTIENLADGAGNDTLIGNAQDNILQTTDGDDEMEGGAGADIFMLSGAYRSGLGTDTIRDYDAAQGDRIVLDSSLKTGAITDISGPSARTEVEILDADDDLIGLLSIEGRTSAEIAIERLDENEDVDGPWI